MSAQGSGIGMFYLRLADRGVASPLLVGSGQNTAGRAGLGGSENPGKERAVSEREPNPAPHALVAGLRGPDTEVEDVVALVGFVGVRPEGAWCSSRTRTASGTWTSRRTSSSTRSCRADERADPVFVKRGRCAPRIQQAALTNWTTVNGAGMSAWEFFPKNRP